MRTILRLLAFVLLGGIAIPVEAQVERPQFRPAVLGSKSDSLVNRIDTKGLLAKGQKDGAVMFCAMVAKTGEAAVAWTYRALPETEALEEELTRKLEEAKFTPAIYNYQPVGVLLFGTAIFSASASPHLLILLNQDPSEIKKGSDFIGPQPVFGADSKFAGLNPPPSGSPIQLTAVVDLGLKVNREGQLQNLRVLGEEPPLLGFAAAAVADFREAKFVPAFRDGDAIDADVVQSICYKLSD